MNDLVVADVDADVVDAAGLAVVREEDHVAGEQVCLLHGLAQGGPLISGAGLHGVAEVLVDIVHQTGAVEGVGTAGAVHIVAADVLQGVLRDLLAQIALRLGFGLRQGRCDGIPLPVGVEVDDPVEDHQSLLADDLLCGVQGAGVVALDGSDADHDLGGMLCVTADLVAIGKIAQIQGDVVDVGVIQSPQEVGGDGEEILTDDGGVGIEDAGAAAVDDSQGVGVEDVDVIGVGEHILGGAQILVGQAGQQLVAAHGDLTQVLTGDGAAHGSGLHGFGDQTQLIHPQDGGLGPGGQVDELLSGDIADGSVVGPVEHDQRFNTGGGPLEVQRAAGALDDLQANSQLRGLLGPGGQVFRIGEGGQVAVAVIGQLHAAGSQITADEGKELRPAQTVVGAEGTVAVALHDADLVGLLNIDVVGVGEGQLLGQLDLSAGDPFVGGGSHAAHLLTGYLRSEIGTEQLLAHQTELLHGSDLVQCPVGNTLIGRLCTVYGPDCGDGTHRDRGSAGQSQQSFGNRFHIQI